MRHEEVADALREGDVLRPVDAVRAQEPRHADGLGGRPAHVADVGRALFKGALEEVVVVAAVEEAAWALRRHEGVEDSDGLFEKGGVGNGRGRRPRTPGCSR